MFGKNFLGMTITFPVNEGDAHDNFRVGSGQLQPVWSWQKISKFVIYIISAGSKAYQEFFFFFEIGSGPMEVVTYHTIPYHAIVVTYQTSANLIGT